MDHSRFQISVAAMLALVACLALNFWLFRLGVIWGLLGLNVTKHVAIAFVCQAIGLNRKVQRPPTPKPRPEPSSN